MNTTLNFDLNAGFDKFGFFLYRFNIELDQITEDLKSFPASSRVKVCEFGCASGATTYCLATILPEAEIIGVDNRTSIITEAKAWRDRIKKRSVANIEDDQIAKVINKLLSIQNPPDFRVGDVAEGENLPSDLDLAYCRRLFVNIKNEGEDKLICAIRNIANSLKPNACLIAVEEASGGNLCRYFDEAGLNCIQIVRFNLGTYFRYIYRNRIYKK